MFKKIKEKLSWEVLEKSLTETVNRFPLSVAFIVVAFILVSLLIHTTFDQQHIETIFVRGIFTSIFGALLAFSSTLMLESYGTTKKAHVAATQAIVLVLTALYAIALPNNLDNVAFDTILVFLLLNFLVLVSSVWARFAKQIKDETCKNNEFYIYNISKLGSFIEAVIISFAGMILTSATFGSIDLLFGVSLAAEWYAQLAAFFFALVAPLYFLAHTPYKVRNELATLGSIGSFIRFLILYIALPFITIYFAILYAYSIQVLMNFSEWPQGTVSWLVIFFSFFGWGIYILSYYIKEEKLVRIFRTYFPYILLPQLAMLFYAIMLRIDQYGITINRYLVVAFGIWLIILCLFYIFSKKKFLAFLPTSLFVMTVVILIGPWGIFASSEKSQLNRLEKLFDENVIIHRGEVITLPQNFVDYITDTDIESINSTIQYLCETHGCESMRELYGASYNKAMQNPDIHGDSPYAGYRKLVAFTAVPEYSRPSIGDERFLSIHSNQENKLIELDDAKNLYLFSTYNSSDTHYIKHDDNKITLSTPDVALDMTDEFIEYLEKHNQFNGRGTPNSKVFDPLVLTSETGGAKVYISSANLSFTRNGDINSLYAEGFIITK